MIYFGIVLLVDGRMRAELNRRFGLANQTFADLETVWKHANLSKHRKFHIHDECALHRLMYSLHTGWFNAAEVKRLDGFYCFCLRRIFNISFLFISRVSNTEVL